jgi:hypothetical protein
MLTGGITRHPRSVSIAFLALVLVGIAMRLNRFFSPIEDAYAFRQTQTASNVELWYRYGFSFLDYHVPIFGGGVWIHEVPFYQLIVFLSAPFAGGIEQAGRLVSIAAFLISMIAISRISSRMFSRNSLAGLVTTLVVFSFVPINVFYYRAFLIDPFVIAISLIALLASVELARRYSPIWLGCLCLCLGVAALSKSSVIFVFSIMIGLLIFRAFRHWGRVTRLLFISYILALFATLLIWISYSGRANVESNGMSWGMMKWWYFGSSIYDPETISTVGGRLYSQLGFVVIGVAVCGVAACLLRKSPHRLPILGLAAGIVLYVPIFTNLNRVHDYYQLPLYPAVAFFAGAGAVALVGVNKKRHTAIMGVAVLLGCLYFVQHSRNELDITYFAPNAVDYNIIAVAGEIKSNTPDNPLVVIGENTDKNDPRLLYEADRVGSVIPLNFRGVVDTAVAAAPGRLVVLMGDWIHPRTLTARYEDAGSGAPVFVLLGNSPEYAEIQSELVIRGYRVTYSSPRMKILVWHESAYLY